MKKSCVMQQWGCRYSHQHTLCIPKSLKVTFSNQVLHSEYTNTSTDLSDSYLTESVISSQYGNCLTWGLKTCAKLLNETNLSYERTREP